MANPPSLGCDTIYCKTVHQLWGYQHIHTVQHSLRRIDAQVKLLSYAKALDLEETAQLHQNYIDSLTVSVNDKLQASMRLGLPLEEQSTIVRRRVYQIEKPVSADEKKEEQIFFSIFERDEKWYANFQDRESWRHRILMLEYALAAPRIFSVSIVPSDPTEEQTWYYKKATYQKQKPQEVLPEEAASCSSQSSSSSQTYENLFELKPKVLSSHDDEKCLIDQNKKHSEENEFWIEGLSTKRRSFTSSAKPESVDSSPPTYVGFFLPFKEFCSELAHPNQDPYHLSGSVLTADVFDEAQVKEILSGLENSEAQNQMQKILDAFVEDTHSRGIGFVLLEPLNKRVKTVFFRKHAF